MVVFLVILYQEDLKYPRSGKTKIFTWLPLNDKILIAEIL